MNPLSITEVLKDPKMQALLNCSLDELIIELNYITFEFMMNGGCPKCFSSKCTLLSAVIGIKIDPTYVDRVIKREDELKQVGMEQMSNAMDEMNDIINPNQNGEA